MHAPGWVAPRTKLRGLWIITRSRHVIIPANQVLQIRKYVR